jgi:hydroxypyruvate isomerase
MPHFSANLSMLFAELPTLERPAAARAAGFGVVEIQFPYEQPATDWVTAKAQAGVEVLLINSPPGDFAAGERGLAALPGREADFRACIAQARDYVAALKVKRVHVMSGITPAAAEPERCAATLAANLDHAAATLAEVGAIAQVEALNSRDVPGYHLTSTAAALAAIDAAGHPNLAIQYDLYHMQIMEGDLIRTMAANLSRIGHIQFADNPGRHEPGTGEINFPQVFAAIDAMGYAGYVGAEYTPSMRTEDTLGWRQV